MAQRAIDTIGDRIDEKSPKRERHLKVVKNDAGTELPPDARELQTSGVLRFYDLNGLPCTLVLAGEGMKIGEGEREVEVFDGLHVNAPHEHAGAFFEAQERRLSLSTKLGLAACLGAAAFGAGCNPNTSTDNSHGGGVLLSDQTIAQMNFALQSADDINHFGPLQPAAFSLDGDKRPVIGDCNGETVISFVRPDGIGGGQHCYYVKAANVEQALAIPNATMIALPGSEGQPADAPVNSCIFDDNKIIYNRGIEGTGIADIVDNGGNLTAQNVQRLDNIVPGDTPIVTSTMKLIEEGGVKYLVHNVGGGFAKLNLTTGEKTISNGNTSCDEPFRDPESGDWIGSKFGNYGGPVHCRVVKANSIEALFGSMQFIPGLLVQPAPVGVTGEGRNAEIQGEVMVLEARMKNPANPAQLLPSKVYYGVVMEWCGNGQCGAGEDNASCAADCPVVVVPPDAGAPDAGTPDAGNPPPDAGTPPPDAGNPPPDAGTPPPDAGNPPPDAGNPPPDAGNPPPDAGNPPLQELCGDGQDNDNDGKTDCLDPECSPHANKITFVSGQENCNATACETTEDFETIDMQGQCTFSIDLGGQNPVVLTIDGSYSIDFLNTIGELLSGKYKVVDNGNQFGTVFGNSVTGVTGTTYEGESNPLNQGPAMYHLECKDGQITLYVNGEEIETLSAGEEGTYDLDNPVPVGADAGGSDGGNEDAGTTGDSDAGGGEDSGDKDAGTEPADGGGTPDSSKGDETPNPDVHKPNNADGDSDPEGKGGGGGCSTAPGSSPKSSPEHLAVFGMLLLMAAAAMRRQRIQKLQEISRQNPGRILINHLRSNLARMWNRITG